MSWEEEIMPIIRKPTKFSQTLLTDIIELESDPGLQEKISKEEFYGEKFRRKKTLGKRLFNRVDLYFDSKMDEAVNTFEKNVSLHNEVLFHQHQCKRMKQI